MIKRHIIFISLLCISFSIMAQPDFYYLQVYNENARVECYLNGFPVYEIESGSAMSNSVPVQMYMVGEGNELEIEMTPINDETPKARGKIIAYKKGEMVDTNSDRKGLVAFKLDGTANTHKVLTFNNEKFNFGDVLMMSPTLSEDKVLAYGKKLYNMVKDGKVDDFIGEMSAKISDFAEALGYPEDAIRNNLSSGLGASFFDTKLSSAKKVTFSAVPYCNDRVWELLVDDHPFLYKEEEGGYSSMKIYVAEVDGAMKIVR